MKTGHIILFSLIGAAIFIVTTVGCGVETDALAHAGGDHEAGSEQLAFEEELDITVEDFHLSLTTDGETLSVEISAPTTGWVAVGFDPSAAMKDANIVIGYVADGQVHLRDDWGSGHTSHEPDVDLGGSDDITGVSGSEEDGVTSISFTIPLDSGTPGDKALVPGSVFNILMAYGPDGSDGFGEYHQWAKVVEIEF